jgi:hypothetical protein
MTLPPGAAFEWPAAVPVSQRQLTPAQVRQRFITPTRRQDHEPIRVRLDPSSFERYDKAHLGTNI